MKYSKSFILKKTMDKLAAPGMLRMVQILTFLKKKNLKLNEIMEEITEIVDNGESQYFDLSDAEISAISDIFQDDTKFNAALTAAGIHKNAAIDARNLNIEETWKKIGEGKAPYREFIEFMSKKELIGKAAPKVYQNLIDLCLKKQFDKAQSYYFTAIGLS